MKRTTIVLYILLSILIITLCSPPPKIEFMKQIKPETPTLINKESKISSSFKRLQSETDNTKISDSIATISFHEEYQIIEHQLNIIPENLPSGKCLASFGFNINSNRISEISNACELTTSRTSQNTCTETHDIIDGYIQFRYSFMLCSDESLTVKYSYKQSKNTIQKLYIREGIVIPLISGSLNCNYKFKIPEGYINLGLQENLLTKESDNIYIYNKECPTDSINDVIRYSPETVSWKADMNLYIEKSDKFTNDVGFIFPRYYRGGKLQNTFYRIFSTEGQSYKEENQIHEDEKLNIKVPAKNKEKVGVLLHTAFTNKLGTNFNVYLPSKYYALNLTNIDQSIKTQVQRIIAQNSDKPDYYKIGKFVYSYITYDHSFFGKNLTLKQIFDGKKGVCEHYTLLYNAMLNCIGIKTFYISGWAFQGDQTSGDKTTEGHAWTAALIDNRWIELDATWGLFEGIPAGHILKNFNNDQYSFYWYETSREGITYYKEPLIEMITDQSKLIDPYPAEEDENEESTNKNNGDGGNDNNNDNSNSENDNNENNNNNNNGNNRNEDDDDNDDLEEFGYHQKPSLILLFLLFLGFVF